jgi:hypothetical protein
MVLGSIACGGGRRLDPLAFSAQWTGTLARTVNGATASGPASLILGTLSGGTVELIGFCTFDHGPLARFDGSTLSFERWSCPMAVDDCSAVMVDVTGGSATLVPPRQMLSLGLDTLETGCGRSIPVRYSFTATDALAGRREPDAWFERVGYAIPAVGSDVQLDASKAYDPLGEPLTYAWTLQPPAGSAVHGISATGSAVSFAPDVAGMWGIALVVRTPFRTSGATSTSIMVNP